MEIVIDEKVQKWHKHEIIEESNSPYANQLVCAKKKASSTRRYQIKINRNFLIKLNFFYFIFQGPDPIRLCIDYRRLNKKTLKNSHPIGDIKDNLARLGGSKTFSLLDSAGIKNMLF